MSRGPQPNGATQRQELERQIQIVHHELDKQVEEEAGVDKRWTTLENTQAAQKRKQVLENIRKYEEARAVPAPDAEATRRAKETRERMQALKETLAKETEEQEENARLASVVAKLNAQRLAAEAKVKEARLREKQAAMEAKEIRRKQKEAAWEEERRKEHAAREELRRQRRADAARRLAPEVEAKIVPSAKKTDEESPEECKKNTEEEAKIVPNAKKTDEGNSEKRKKNAEEEVKIGPSANQSDEGGPGESKKKADKDACKEESCNCNASKKLRDLEAAWLKQAMDAAAREDLEEMERKIAKVLLNSTQAIQMMYTGGSKGQGPTKVDAQTQVRRYKNAAAGDH